MPTPPDGPRTITPAAQVSARSTARCGELLTEGLVSLLYRFGEDGHEGMLEMVRPTVSLPEAPLLEYAHAYRALRDPCCRSLPIVDEVTSSAAGSPAVSFRGAPGDTLRAWTAAQGGLLSTATSLAISEHVVDALIEARARGISHGALSPNNIRISRAGQCVVYGFGHLALLRAAGSLAHAREYLVAPTLITAEGNSIVVPESAEVWSVCALLVLLLTGRRPDTDWPKDLDAALKGSLVDTLERGLAIATSNDIADLQQLRCALRRATMGRLQRSSAVSIRTFLESDGPPHPGRGREPYARGRHPRTPGEPAGGGLHAPVAVLGAEAGSASTWTVPLRDESPCISELAHTLGDHDLQALNDASGPDLAARWAPGSIVAWRYEIHARLGEGGMGEVFRAHDTILRRTVALKRLRTESAAGPPVRDTVDRLMAEARAAAAIQHPNVVAIYDVGEHEGEPYFSMEFLDGHPLRELLRSRALRDLDGLRILAQVAYALLAAHATRIVHRDVKPENIFVLRDGRVKVLDFGIAWAAEAQLGDASDEQLALGTPMYMAPEQLVGEPPDPRTDQYQWGLLAFELLCGKVPTMVGATRRVDAAAASLHLPWPNAVPASLRDTLRRTLAPRKESRFGSLAEPLGVLEECLRQMTRHRGRALGIRAPQLYWAAALCVAGVFAILPPLHRRGTPGGTANSPAVPTADELALTAARRMVLDAAVYSAHRRLESLLASTPTNPEAHLLFTLLGPYWVDDTTRAHFQSAASERHALSPESSELLTAHQPLMDPRADYASVSLRLESAYERFPSAITLHALLRNLTREGNFDRVRTLVADRGPAVEPIHLFDLGVAEALADNIDTASELFEKCTRVSTSGEACLTSLAALQANEGRCEALERTAQRMLAIDASSNDGILYLAQARWGRQAEGTWSLVERYVDGLSPSSRAAHAARWRAIKAVYLGKLDEALEATEQWVLATTRDPIDNALATELHVQLAADSSLHELARRTAQDFDERHPLVNRNPFVDPSIWVHSALFAAGLESEVKFRALQSAWFLSEQQRSTLVAHSQTSWVWAVAASARDARDAATIASATPSYSQLPDRFTRSPDMDWHIGRLHFLAGDLPAAARHLNRAVAACSNLEVPYAALNARLLLAEAVLQTGDRAAACKLVSAVPRESTRSRIATSARRLFARACS